MPCDNNSNKIQQPREQRTCRAFNLEHTLAPVICSCFHISLVSLVKGIKCTYKIQDALMALVHSIGS